jgi:hypothetical protein
MIHVFLWKSRYLPARSGEVYCSQSLLPTTEQHTLRPSRPSDSGLDRLASSISSSEMNWCGVIGLRAIRTLPQGIESLA